MWQCSQQHENREEAKFCAKCGEKRVERVICSACNSVLEPDDVFCVICGLKRGVAAPVFESLPLPAPVVVPRAAPPPVVEPPIAPAPPVVTAAPPVVPIAPPEPPAAAPPTGESFSFSFGGATIGAQTPVKKVKPAKSPMATGMLSFVVLGVLLLVALYLLSR